MRVSFEVSLHNVLDKQFETPYGKVLYDGYTEEGIRLHVVADHIEHPTVWRNAIVLGTNHIDVEEGKMREINIENTIYINNLLANPLEDEYTGYSVCMVVPEHIDRIIIDQYSATLEYNEPYEDWVDTWCVPKKYFYMTDQEILADAKAEYLAEEARQRKQELLQLEQMAKEHGYKLVKLELVKLEEANGSN